MLGFIKAFLGLGYSKKKIVNVIRIESDEFEICKPKLVNTRNHMFGEKNRLVHFTGDKYFTMDL